MQERNAEQLVRKYYDRNTGKFLLLARRTLPKALHQPLYELPTMSHEDALHTHHRKILRLIPDTSQRYHVLDLGCGVGESMIYLARHTPEHLRYYGITLSGTQAEQALARIKAERLEQRISVIQGSFQAIPSEIPQAHLAFCIEAFVHSPDARMFFAQVSNTLYPQGRLVVFDDFLLRSPVTTRERQIVSDMRRGWLANALLTKIQTTEFALESGLVLESSSTLSSQLRMQRPRDRLVHMLVPFARLFSNRSEYCRFLIGGDSRQRAYQNGLLEYAMFVFMKK